MTSAYPLHDELESFHGNTARTAEGMQMPGTMGPPMPGQQTLGAALLFRIFKVMKLQG